MTRLRIAVLGQVRVSRDGVAVDLGTLRHREVVAALALAGGEPVPSAVLIDRVWGEGAPATALATLHGYIASLRRLLEPDRPPRAPATVLVTHADAYALLVDPEDRDEHRFEQLVNSARARLSVVADHLLPRVAHQDREAVETALDELEDATTLWRGTPYLELGDDRIAAAHRARLEGLLRTAHELRAVGQLALGLHDVVRGDLEARTAEYPLHERWWALRAVALARDSRQADALAVLDELRSNLAEELGVDPSPPLQDVRTAILRQDPSVTCTPGPAASPTSARPPSTRVEPSPWKLTGREADLQELREALARAEGRRGGFVLLTGDAGIGKSRLVEEVALEAVTRGWRLAVGQCSQEDGAPPLWPWMSILAALDLPFVPPDQGVEAGALFRVLAEISRLAREAAEDRPLLLVLEDLHWADPSTLGVLRLLAESVTTERLLVIATWRSPSESRSDLHGVAEALARRHAVRRALVGLDERATVRLFEDVSGRTLPPAAAIALHRRTQGNPFFVVELARLAGDDDRELDDLLAPGALPAAVAEVVALRFAALPEPTTAVLRTAAILGHTFDLETLADVTRLGTDDLLDSVEPALAAGLLDEDGVEVFRFSHALVGDVLRASMSATRLARTHRVVAELLEQRPGREAEVAWHWREAGPRFVDRAWRATAAAAGAATQVRAYVDAADLLLTALQLQADDDTAGPQEELELLDQAIDVFRWASLLPELVAAVERSIVVATGLDDVPSLGRAATQTTHRMGWRSAPYGAVNEVVVGALRRALDELPDDERELRARALVSLASELREEAPLSDRQRLCAEAVELARSLHEPRLLCDVLILAPIATWGPPTTSASLAHSLEAAELADELGDRHAHLMARVVTTVAYGELGRVDEMWASLESTRREAVALRAVYAELTLDELELAWLAAGGRFAECDRLLEDVGHRLALMGSTSSGGGLAPAQHFDLFALQLWKGRPLDALPGLTARIEAGLPMQVFAVVALWRGGRRAEAAAAFVPTELHELLDRDMGFSSALRCAIAEAALYFGDSALARHAYERLAPYAGRTSGADGLFLGPIDAFLALAARADGETEAASRHADRALRSMDEWRLPRGRTWLEDLRHTYGF